MVNHNFDVRLCISNNLNILGNIYFLFVLMLKLSTTYQHLRGREGECHDAVVWDVAQSEHHVGSTEEPPELECQESDSEEPMLDNPAPHSKV